MIRTRRCTDVRGIKRPAYGTPQQLSLPSSLLLGRCAPESPSGCTGGIASENYQQYRANLAIIVANIPGGLDESAIRKIFRRFGDVYSVEREPNCLENETWQCRILYRTFDGAKSAVESMNNSELVKDTTPVSVTFAKSQPQFVAKRRGSCTSRFNSQLDELFMSE